MKCRNPYIKDGAAYGCGQCMPCRIDAKRVWTSRIMLESFMYSDNVMVTLTYDDDHLPADGSLVRKHPQDFLKRLRKSFSPYKFRFFGCGEYGEKNMRPHYHIILFNYPNCLNGQSLYSKIHKNCCKVCDHVRDTWGFGGVFLNEVNNSTAQYCAGYVTKKMTAKDDPRLKGLYQEFPMYSLRPGIGADMMWEVADSLLRFNLVDRMADVPSALRIGSRLMPIGSYLQRKLRVYVGRSPEAPEETLKAIKEELRPLREAAFDNSRSFKKEVIRASDQAVLNMQAKQKLFTARKDLL